MIINLCIWTVNNVCYDLRGKYFRCRYYIKSTLRNVLISWKLLMFNLQVCVYVCELCSWYPCILVLVNADVQWTLCTQFVSVLVKLIITNNSFRTAANWNIISWHTWTIFMWFVTINLDIDTMLKHFKSCSDILGFGDVYTWCVYLCNICIHSGLEKNLGFLEFFLGF